MKKIVLEFSQDELGIIFDCMCGSFSCPPEYGYLVNYVAKNSTGNGVYCPNH